MQPSQEGIYACARWLSYCLSIGWKHADLDELERMWWEHHDERGKLRSPGQSTTTGKSDANG